MEGVEGEEVGLSYGVRVVGVALVVVVVRRRRCCSGGRRKAIVVLSGSPATAGPMRLDGICRRGDTETIKVTWLGGR